MKLNDFNICVATVNGSGSQSSNNILMRAIFNMGIPVAGKNLFPSNIAGMPTWFWIRGNEQAFLSRKIKADILVNLNPATINDDIQHLQSGGIFIISEDAKLLTEPNGVSLYRVPFKKLVEGLSESIKVKKYLINMVYVGILAEMMGIEQEALEKSMHYFLGEKEKVLEPNRNAVLAGRQFLKENPFPEQHQLRLEQRDLIKNKMLLDGNTAGALGSLMGGCTVFSWYPITPATSLGEKFISFAQKYRKDENGKNKFAVIQAEDELAAVCMVLGAGWAGARAMTSTSGPGLSLMQETAGYSYYSEIPGVIWDVQRVGPSTGMPTRTMQADILSAVYASHGDTLHICLFPANPNECYEFGQISFDLAEQLQQFVFVLSDLDIGMNFWLTEDLKYPENPYQRGKLVNNVDATDWSKYERFGDPDGDGVSLRALPGMPKIEAAYLTRGSGHNMKAGYTEKGAEYVALVDKLKRKWETAKNLVPKPIIRESGNSVGVIAFGSTDAMMLELQNLSQIKFDYLRVRALPFTQEIENFVSTHEKIFVIEQNRDGQLIKLLQIEYPQFAARFHFVGNYDGLPISAEKIAEVIL